MYSVIAFYQSVSVDILYIDKQGDQNKLENVAMTWIDYKKAYAMVLQKLIEECLKIYKIFYKVINFIRKTMENR